MPGLGNGLGLDKRRPTGSGKMLDGVSGLADAYSLRYVISSFSGDVIIAEKGAGPVETEGFTPNEIKNGDLVSWADGGNVFVRTVKGQINGLDVTDTTRANQPKIVDSGALVVDGNGNPAMQFSGSQSLLNNSPGLDSIAYSAFMVASADIDSSARTLLRCRLLGAYGTVEGASFLEYDSDEESVNIFIDDGSGNAIGVANSSFSNDGSTRIITTILTSVSANTWINGSNVGGADNVEAGVTPAGSVSLPFIDIGGGQVSRGWQGLVSEIILADSNQSANRTAIESAINSYYSIY